MVYMDTWKYVHVHVSVYVYLCVHVHVHVHEYEVSTQEKRGVRRGFGGGSKRC